MGNVQKDEDGLWSRRLRGDGEEFAALYDRHRDPGLSPRVQVVPWLLVTTTNMARNHGRAALRHRRLLDSLAG